MKYILELDEQQAGILAQACDTLSRVYCGQIGITIEPLLHWRQGTGHKVDQQTLEAAVAIVHQELTGLSRNANFGIHSPEIPDAARVSFDLSQVIRHALWLGQGGTRPHSCVDATVSRTSTEQPLATITGLEKPSVG